MRRRLKVKSSELRTRDGTLILLKNIAGMTTIDEKNIDILNETDLH
ncbi:MAG: hypothetical protein WCK13_07235 [Ignavibacteriota bacterium]